MLDPVIRAPLFGSLLMCFSSSLLSVLLFVRKKSLVGESIAHSTYPGVVLGGFLSIFFDSEWFSLWVLIGAFFTALLGAISIEFLKKKMKLREDAALCFSLATFFGIGVTLYSAFQFIHPASAKSIQGYLYGMTATMTDHHIWIYGFFASLILVFLVVFFKEFQATSFDPGFSQLIGIPIKKIDFLILVLVTLAVVVGIRSVGVVLMSAMLIAPAVSARAFTHNLKTMFFLAALFGLMASFFGSLLSFQSESFALPAGPLIVLISGTLALISLLFAPKRGLVIRYFRILLFSLHCRQENILKAMWRSKKRRYSFRELKELSQTSFGLFLFQLVNFRLKGWLIFEKGSFFVTPGGASRASEIVRLHRLWEVYLVDYLGHAVERVHKSAEEMEHILTPELERELTNLLKDPLKDPHNQPIPPRGELYG